MFNSENQTQLVVFSLGRDEYALPIGHVREIVRYSEPSAVASSAPWVRGVIDVRGETVPVCDLAARLGATTGAAKIVIVETEAGVSGVIVDDVKEVVSVAAEQLRSVAGSGAGLVHAVARIDDRLVIVLDPNGILDRPGKAAARA
jgi:purine-binding chemotaxis protein CheW